MLENFFALYARPDIREYVVAVVFISQQRASLPFPYYALTTNITPHCVLRPAVIRSPSSQPSECKSSFRIE